MKVCTTISELKAELLGLDHPLGFVPTMGALHSGHISLISRSIQECASTVVSIFVNPLQFAPTDDLSKYPRPLEADLAACESAGADLVFVPTPETMYTGLGTTVSVLGVSSRWEGEHRPGHFDGVATVVSKLFNLVAPEIAYFGEKDFQQCAVIEKLVKDLNFNLRVERCPTVREADGLAMSSRNAYLSSEQRIRACEIYSSMQKISAVASTTHYEVESVRKQVAMESERLSQLGFDIDYLVVIDELTLEPWTGGSRGGRILFAGRLGQTRLIDNITL